MRRSSLPISVTLPGDIINAPRPLMTDANIFLLRPLLRIKPTCLAILPATSGSEIDLQPTLPPRFGIAVQKMW